MTAPDMTIRETTMAVFKPKNSKNYHFRYMLNGKIHTGSTKSTNKQAAERFEQQHKNERHKCSVLGDPEAITLRLAIENYLESKRRKIGNFERLQRKCEKLLGITHDHFGGKKQCFGFDPERKLHTIKEKDIQRLIAEREKEGLLPQSILNEMTIWNQLINLAKRMGYMIPDISIADLKKANGIKIGKGKLRFLTLDEEARLLEEIHPKKSVRGLANYEDQDNETRRKRQDLYDLVILLLDTGARYSEIGEIKWSSIDMLSRTIYLFRPKVQNQSILHMSNRVFEVLSRRFAAPNRTEYVFTDISGKGVRKYSCTGFSNACSRAGLEGVSFHTLRHTFASRMVQAGLPITDIQQVLGHASIQMTTRYAHLAPLQSSSRAVAILNQINSQKSLPSVPATN